MDYTKEESLFIEFLESYPQFYKESHKIAENKDGISILSTTRGRNKFKMYSLDDICQSCSTFIEDGLRFTPKTTDAIWYKKIKNNFYIFLIEFKGHNLCKNSSKCTLVDVLETIKIKNQESHNDFNELVISLEKVVSKFSDKMLNGLAAKPLETVTISLPLIYEEYYEKNKDNIEFLDIRNFLRNSRIIYRVVSIADDKESTRLNSRGKAYRCSNAIPTECKILAQKLNDKKLEASYESSLQTYHKRYEHAGIVYDAGFVDNRSFNNFIVNYLK